MTITRSAVAVSLLLAAACSGGGGEAPFTPSPDLSQSHPFLFATWGGLARSNAGGPAMTMGVRMDPPPAADPSFGIVESAVINTLFVGSDGSYQADGDRVHVFMYSPLGVGDTCDMDLRVSQDHQSMTGTYRITLGSGAPRDAGTVELGVPPADAGIEVYETPDLLLVIRRR